MFLQENLNQKKTASYKDIRLELLEDIIIFNEQFEELKYEVCLTENALVATSDASPKPEEKESLLKRMGDGAKKIWKTIIEYLTNLYDKIVRFFSDYLNKVSLKNKKSRFNYLYMALQVAKANPLHPSIPKEVELIKEYDVKEYSGKITSLFREETSDANTYRNRVEANIKKLEDTIKTEEERLKTAKRDKVSIDEAIRIFDTRFPSINALVGTVESNTKTILEKLKAEATKYSSENNDNMANEVRSKISTANKAISFALKAIVKITSFVNASVDYKPRINIMLNKEGREQQKRAKFSL